MDRETAKHELRTRIYDYLADTGRAIRPEPVGGACPICGGGQDTPNTHIKNHVVKCFACEWSGDIFDLVGHDLGLSSFPDRLKAAADHFNVSLDDLGQRRRQTPEEAFGPLEDPKPQPIQQPGPDFTGYYQQCRAKPGPAIAYMMGRGISREICEAHSTGYDPGRKLAVIPITSGFYVARSIEGREFHNPKNVKIAIDPAALDQLEPVFIVEGIIDAMSIEAAGGLALSLNSVNNAGKLLEAIRSRETIPPLILALDNDAPGRAAAEKLAAALEGLGVICLQADLYGSHKDANELIQADPAGLAAALREASAAVARMKQSAEQAAEEEKALALAEYRHGNTAGGYLYSYLDEVSERTTRPPAATGFPRLDEALDGGLKEGLYIFGAVSSLGKTTFALQIADNIAASGRDVLLFSLEQSKYELISKSISRHSYARKSSTDKPVCHLELAGGGFMKYSAASKRFILETMTDYQDRAGNRLFIIEERPDGSRYTVLEISEAVDRHIKLTGNRPVVFVDYLQIIKPLNERATDKQTTDTAITELKRISRRYKIPVFSISSLNRENYTAPITMAAFKESGGIEFSADVLLGLQIQGAEEFKDGNKAANNAKVHRAKSQDVRALELKILKNRSGKIPDEPLPLRFRARFNHFEEGTRPQPGISGMDEISGAAAGRGLVEILSDTGKVKGRK